MTSKSGNSHIAWFNQGVSLLTNDNKEVRLLEFVHDGNEEIMSEWARHFRNHYCKDSDIDKLRSGTNLSRREYLEQLVFPDAKQKPGPSVRASDFSEILIADYFKYILSFHVPRLRYSDKANRNTSTQGIDILGFKLVKEGTMSPDDELITCEVKAALSSVNEQLLQKAYEGSANDYVIKTSEALNAAKRRLEREGRVGEAEIIARFQNITDRPHKRISAAAGVCSAHTWKDSIVSGISLGPHPNSNILLLIVRGEKLMDLANKLFEAAYAEA